MLHQDGRWGVPSGSAATSHILKPAITGLDDHDLNEHLCLAAARGAGLIAARSRVVRFNEQRAIAIERYDRRRTEDGLVRIHQEDVAQALGVHPAGKYQSDGGPGPSEIVELFRIAMPAVVADDATRRFVDALAWNWLTGGTDAHAKNYSLLLSAGEVRLAPLYDIASALPYDVDPLKLRLAMKLGGEYRYKAHSARSWERASAELGLDADEVRGRVHDLATRTPDALRDAATSPDVTALASALPSRLVDVIADRAATCAEMLRSRRHATS